MSPAEAFERIRGAADLGHCLECGCDLGFAAALRGVVLCQPCDAVAAEHEAALAAHPMTAALLDVPAEQPTEWARTADGWRLEPIIELPAAA